MARPTLHTPFPSPFYSSMDFTSQPRPYGPQTYIRVTRQAKTKPQARSVKELVNRLGQRSQLAAPGYADSTKLGTAFIYYLRTLDEVR